MTLMMAPEDTAPEDRAPKNRAEQSTEANAEGGLPSKWRVACRAIATKVNLLAILA